MNNGSCSCQSLACRTAGDVLKCALLQAQEVNSKKCTSAYLQLHIDCIHFAVYVNNIHEVCGIQMVSIH